MKTILHVILVFIACAAVGLAIGHVGEALHIPLAITFLASLIAGFAIVWYLGPPIGGRR